MAGVKLDIGRVQRPDGPYWVALLTLGLDDGTELPVGSYIREDELRHVARSYAHQAVQGVGGGFSAPSFLTEQRGPGGRYTIWKEDSHDVFAPNRFVLYGPTTPAGDKGPLIQSVQEGGPGYPQLVDEMERRARGPRDGGAVVPGGGGGGPPGGGDVYQGGGGTRGGYVVAPGGGGGGPPKARAATGGGGGAVVALSAETARRAGVQIPPPQAGAAGPGVLRIASGSPQQASLQLSAVAASMAQRIAAGAIDPSTLDANNAVEAQAYAWAPVVPPDANAIPYVDPGDLYTAADVPPGGAAMLPELPPDTLEDPASHFFYSPSTGCWFDPTTHALIGCEQQLEQQQQGGGLPPDVVQDPSTGYLYSPSYGAFFDPYTGELAGYAQEPASTPSPGGGYDQGGAYDHGDGAAYAAAMWEHYHGGGGGVQGLSQATIVGDLWSDIGTDIEAAAKAILGNDVVQKALDITAPILAIALPALGIPLAAANAALHAASIHPATAAAAAPVVHALAAGHGAAHAVLSGQASPHEAVDYIAAAEASDDPLMHIAAGVLRTLTGG